MRFAVVLASFTLLYPMLRLFEVFPTHALVEVSSILNDQRGASLQFRFDQEEELLERASNRLVFGWGRYGRNRIFKEDWKGDAYDTSVTDGLWIITLGQFGLVGFLTVFGLLAIPVFRAASAVTLVNEDGEGVFLAAIALILSINMVDLLPNSALSPWTLLIAGSLLGRSEAILERARIGTQPGRVISNLREKT